MVWENKFVEKVQKFVEEIQKLNWVNLICESLQKGEYDLENDFEVQNPYVVNWRAVVQT